MNTSDKEVYNMTISLNKALNPMETPLKLKHVRSVIITSHRIKEAKSFWSIVSRQPLMENQFTAWKFCHLLHKLLREGHESIMRHSRLHKKMILEMGKLWGHLQDGVGPCIESYSKLIVTKLDFHEKYAFFAGNLLTDFRDIEKFSGDDINMYFQLCVDIFDYLESIIDVQSKVFAATSTYRMTSMTPKGQCRLAPIIALIQDSNPLYDLSVRIMFHLHDKISSDILSGHRNRFCDIFDKLKLFYENVRPLQYFVDLIQVPYLPETAPNFTSKFDLRTYVPPIVVVPPENEPTVPEEIDRSSLEQNNSQIQEALDKMVIYEITLKEKDEVIKQLKCELIDQREKFKSGEIIHQQEKEKLSEEVALLKEKLVDEREYNADMKMINNELEVQLQTRPTLLQKISEEEERAKGFQEKFNKLKIMYNQIREEHILLLRQHGETTKQLNMSQTDNSDLLMKNEHLKCRLEEIEENLGSQKGKLLRQNLDLEAKIKGMCDECEILAKRFQELQEQHRSLQSDVSDLFQYKSRLSVLENDLEKQKEQEAKEKSQWEKQIVMLKEDANLRESESVRMKESHACEMGLKIAELQGLKEEYNKVQSILQEKEEIVERITVENESLNKKLGNLVHQNEMYESDINKLSEELNSKSFCVKQTEMHRQNLIDSVIKAIIGILKNGSSRNQEWLNETELQRIENISICCDDIEVILDEFNSVLKLCSADKKHDAELLGKVILAGHRFTTLNFNCILLLHNAAYIQKGQEIFANLHSFNESLIRLLCTVSPSKPIEMGESNISECKLHLDKLHSVITNITQSTNTSLDLENLVEVEMSEMERAIEEATEQIAKMLSSARVIDHGIKLHVNEKILDACTLLIKSIKVLIQKSRSLQEEIVSLGKGSVSSKEFYKRNSQWSEGLISASKSVAKGAKLLVEAADKAVSVSGQKKESFEIIVAAQEIAAYTAQLVAASRVQAPKESSRLDDLKKASRDVSHATGVVVATVQNCNQHFEVSDDIDISKLTNHQAKTIEMNMHVKVLELEQALQVERLRLSAFRRQNYHNVDN